VYDMLTTQAERTLLGPYYHLNRSIVYRLEWFEEYFSNSAGYTDPVCRKAQNFGDPQRRSPSSRFLQRITNTGRNVLQETKKTTEIKRRVLFYSTKPRK